MSDNTGIRRAPTDPTSLQVVFVCGSSRSGTTMTGRLLGRSPVVHTMEELHYFEGIWDPSDDRPLSADRARNATARLVAIERGGFRHPAPVAACEHEANCILDGLTDTAGPAVYAAFVAHRAAATGTSIVCDQTPRNVYLLEQLLDWYPRARAVIVVRDPRDVLLSQKNRWRRRQRGIETMSRRDQLRLWSGYHPITMSHLWRSAAEVGLHLSEHPRVHVVRFEDLVTTPEATVRALCDATGVPFERHLLDVPQSGSSHGPVRVGASGLDPNAVGRWRTGGLTSTEIVTTEHLTAGTMEAFGYEASGWTRSPWRAAGSAGILPVKGALALALNLSRSRRILRVARRRFGSRRRTGPEAPQDREAGLRKGP